MPVNFLNLPGLRITDFKEGGSTEYHVRAEPLALSRMCVFCGQSHQTVIHDRRTLIIRDIPSHGRAVAIHPKPPHG